MRDRTWAAALSMAGLAAAALGAAPPSGVTEGELALMMARAAGIELPAAGAEEAARAALGKCGIVLGIDLRAPLTQGSLTRIGRSAGASVSTASPRSLVTPAVGQAFVRSIAPALRMAAASAAGGTTQLHVSCQGRDSRSGRKGTPASNANPNATAPPCGGPTP